MANGGRGVAGEILRALSTSYGIKKNLSLMVDALYALTGSQCSAFLLSPRDDLVCWEYSRSGSEGAGSTSRRAPYRLDAGSMGLKEGWEVGGGSVRVLRALDEDTSLMLRLRTGGAMDDPATLRGIVEEVLPAITASHREERQRRERAEALAAEHIARIVGGLGEKRKALRLLAAAICKGIDAERAAVLHYSPDERALRVVAAYGRMKEPSRKPRSLRLGEGVAGWCLLNRKPANLVDARSDPRYLEGSFDDIRTMLCVPVLEGERPLGAICAVNRHWPYAGLMPGFKLADQRFLEMLSAETAPLFREP